MILTLTFYWDVFKNGVEKKNPLIKKEVVLEGY